MGISQYPFGSQGNLRRKRNCLHEIATAPLGPRNDKPLVFTILTAVRLLRRCSAGRGMPRPYGGCIMLYYLKKPFLTVSKISSAFLPQVSSIFRQ